MNMNAFREADQQRAQRFTAELLPKLTPEFLSTLRLAAELCDWAACDLDEVASFVHEIEARAKDGSKDVDAGTDSAVALQHADRSTGVTVEQESALRVMAESACIAANGLEDWHCMFSGDKEAEINAWIDGYKAGNAAASGGSNSG